MKIKSLLNAISIFICLVILFVFQYQELQVPGEKKYLYNIVRNTPTIIFYTIFIVCSVIFIGPWLYIVLFNPEKRIVPSADYSINNARKLAVSLWKVEGQPILRNNGVVVRFMHFSWSNQGFALSVLHGHPDIKQFRQLNDGDVVEFEALEVRIECGLENNPCAYLRIKSVKTSNI